MTILFGSLNALRYVGRYGIAWRAMPNDLGCHYRQLNLAIDALGVVVLVMTASSESTD